uniref:Hint domain-containing protein n=1 Tax=Panagrolaimus davidi TaxID=227884 RepID=A0A914PHX3_9BILA
MFAGTPNGLGAAAGAGAGACFSGDTIVKILNGKEKRMNELKIGDWVLSGGQGKMGFSKIVSWLHRMPNVKFEFLKLTLENGKSLKITKKHFIYKFDCSANKTHRQLHSSKPVLAENVQISDCLLSRNNKTNKFLLTKISKTETIQEIGIFAPLTDNGNIVVNDIFASCSSEIDNFSLSFILPVLNKYFKIAVKIFEIFSDSVFFESQRNEIELIPGIQSLINFAKNVV